MTKNIKLRLYVDGPLGAGQTVLLTKEQAHRLFTVMRLAVGDHVALFNGTSGEWRAEAMQAGKRKGVLLCQDQTAAQLDPPDLWLLFAPIKKARTEFIVEKATETGAARVFPVQTDFTNAERLKHERLQAHMVAAAQQCGGTYVPPLEPVQKLSRLLDQWPDDRQLLFCDETRVGQPVASLQNARRGKWAIVIGPEGGFSPNEAARLRAMPQATSISLGPRILRADTAVVAALTLWQQALGDWG